MNIDHVSYPFSYQKRLLTDDTIEYIFHDPLSPGRADDHVIYPVTILSTDPICCRTSAGSTTVYTTEEQVKEKLRLKFNLPALTPTERLHELITPSLIPQVQVSAKTDNDKPQVKDSKKLSSKITRSCAHSDCDIIVSSYRSKLSHGSGLFCCKEHASLNQKVARVHNKCLTCDTEYDSLTHEDYCSDQCSHNP